MSYCRIGGYALVEVVVSMAIAGIALTALLQAVQGNAERSSLSREYVVATSLGESMLARIGRDIALDTGTERGLFDDAFAWTRTITPYNRSKPALETGSGLPVSPYEVVVTVSWRSGGRPRDLSLRSLRLKKNNGHPG